MNHAKQHDTDAVLRAKLAVPERALKGLTKRLTLALMAKDDAEL
jgi:hypothetical protein